MLRLQVLFDKDSGFRLLNVIVTKQIDIKVYPKLFVLLFKLFDMVFESGAPETLNKKPYKIFIDKVKYETSNSRVTGAELKKMAGLSDDTDLFLINQGPRDLLIGNDEMVDLSRPGVEHFASRVKVKEFKIIVNGREKIWGEPAITFEQLMKLAFGIYEDKSHIAYTSTYDKGPKENRNGVFVKGQSVFVTNNMVFNATRTDKS